MKDTGARPDIIIGTYRHYKGGVYSVIDVVCHTETLKWHVLYESHEHKEKGLPSLWVRPYEMFIENVIVDGETRPRFEFIGD